MQITSRRFPVLALALAFVSVSAHAQQPSTSQPPRWAGWARCQINVQGPGYTDQQTHTWTLAGGTPTVEGAFRIYAGTWSVVGGGSLHKTQGSQTLVARWATNVPGMSGPIAVFVRASDGRRLISARHPQLRARGAIGGYQQVSINGKPQKPGMILAEAFEWQFPVANGPSTSTRLSGSSRPVVSGRVGLMQPADSRGTASCTWQFGQGSAAPTPPPTVTAQAIPTPPAPGAATGQPSGQPAGGGAGGGAASGSTCASAPRNLVASASGPTVTLRWAAPASGVPLSYMIQAGSLPGKSNLSNFNTGDTLLSMVISNVPFGSYYVRIAARDTCGDSMASNEILLVVG